MFSSSVQIKKKKKLRSKATEKSLVIITEDENIEN